MRTTDVFGNIFCSEKIIRIRAEGKEVIYILVVSLLLGITAIVGNTLILIALHKNTSLHQPSKALLRNLVASDLCVGFVQLVHGAVGISILQGWWQMCHLLFLVNAIASNISITISLWTITAISVDRLLALLLKLRYRRVVTIKKVYTVALASWVNGISNATLWFFSLFAWKVLLGTNIAVCLITSVYCYTRTFLRLRHQHTQVLNNRRQPENQASRIDEIRYRKTLSSSLWLLLALLFCYLPYLFLVSFAFREIENNPSSVFIIALTTTALLMYFNSTLNPILYCWRIKEVRRAVKDTLSCSRE
ncbi:PREDICTED: adenosine receptor A2a-like isoform X1 [Acropora digitifera]|uniref:adenosine receptor A2a-like isoform X1 n=1 Tax=Acropora digitifera TaxID=70779 RepID=UPI00077AD7FC|nr:PREDICTED: adenosine receptor A2a-like isoform X1 [Acropora digitifera]XP_015765043.1 PREDICTED: adenosine receptor A2a-like isoform X1 [Acropora digitifera]